MITLFSTLDLFFIFLFLCLINGIFNFYCECKELNIPYETIKKEFRTFVRYTDKYYITNLFYTCLACFIYLFGSIFIFLIIRYLFIGQVILFSKIESGNASLNNILIFIIQYILFICCLLLYRLILKKTFYIEILKLRIYFNKQSTRDLIVFPWFTYLCGFIWMLTERIATSTYNPYLFEKDFDYWYEKQLYPGEHEYNSLYKNSYVQKLAFIFIPLTNNFFLIKLIFSLISKCFRIIHRHAQNRCLMFTHYMFFILLFLYEIYYLEFYYIYCGSFILGLSIVYTSYRKFEEKFSLSDIYTLHDYFYGAFSNYKKERTIFLKNENYQIDLNALHNKKLYNFFNTEDFITYSVYNDLESYMTKSSDKNKIHDIFLYLRGNIIFGFIVISIYYLLLNNNIVFKIKDLQVPLWFIFLGSIIIMIFCSNNAYYRVYLDEYTLNESFMTVVHNKKYHFVFWIITIFQGYVFWLIIFKPQIMFLSTEILLQVPYDIIYIKKVYSIQQKIMYLHQYFEYYITLFDSQLIDKEYLRHILRQIKFKPLLYNNNISLQDIQIYIKILIDNYLLQEAIIPVLIQPINDPNSWYILLRNSIFIASLFKTICYIISLYILTKKIDTTNGTHDLVRYIVETALYKKVTISQFVTIFMKILRESKEI